MAGASSPIDAACGGEADLVPIVSGLHPDPTICRVGEDYYLAHSSMEYSPAIPIRHSRDLVNWTLLGNALDRDDQFPAGHALPSQGIWAPTLRHRDGTFYLITTDSRDTDAGQLLFRATDPAGPWSAAVTIPELRGIDPDLAWDDDGTCLVTYCAWTDTDAGIKQAAIDIDTGKALEEPRWVWRGSGLSNPEGPHLYRHGTWWYLVIAEGGTATGHAISVARSPTARGPFSGAAHNPIFSHRSTSHTVQNIGHADLVEGADTAWAAVYLGVRKRGGTPQFHTNGRETFLARIEWVDDWPVFAPADASVPSDIRVVDDDFPSLPLHSRWISPGLHPADLVAHRGGTLRVRHGQSASGQPSGLFTRVQSLYWCGEFEISSDRSRSRVMVRLDDDHWYGLRVYPSPRERVRVEAVSRVGDLETIISATEVAPERVCLVVEASADTSANAKTRAPDRIRLGVRVDDKHLTLANLDGRYLSTEVAGGFTGRVLGLVVDQGEAQVHRFRMRDTSIT